MAELIRRMAFEKNTKKNEKQSTYGRSNNPGKTMLLISRDESERGSEKDNNSDNNVNPGRMGVSRDGRENDR